MDDDEFDGSKNATGNRHWDALEWVADGNTIAEAE